MILIPTDLEKGFIMGFSVRVIGSSPSTENDDTPELYILNPSVDIVGVVSTLTEKFQTLLP